MKRFEEQIRICRGRQQDICLNEDKILLAIRKSKDAFYENEQNRPVSWPEFLFWQASYIQKRWWIFQAVILVILWWFLTTAHSDIYLQRGIGAMAPLFAVMLLPELWKNRSTGSVEIEGASFYSLRQIYAARMLLLAMADVLLLSVFFLTASFTVSVTVGEIMLQFFLPFNVTCCICFRTLYSRRFESEYFAMGLCMLWTAVWYIAVLRSDLYETISKTVWLGAVLLSALYLCYSIYRSLKECGNCVEIA